MGLNISVYRNAEFAMSIVQTVASLVSYSIERGQRFGARTSTRLSTSYDS